MKPDRNLALLLSGQLISQIGDKFYLLALSYWVLESTRSAAMMGMVLFFSLLPQTIMGFVAGAVVDKFDRKWIMITTDLLRGGVVLVLALLFYLEAANVLWIIVAQILLSLNTAFFDPCIPAVIPQIVPSGRLAQANAQTQLIRGLSTVLGPVLGGIAVGVFGYVFVFVLNGLSFILSALLESALKLPAAGKTDGNWKLLADIKAGLTVIIKANSLVALILSIAVIHFFVGAFQTVTPVLANRLEGSGVRNLGYLQTAFGVGMVAVSLIFGLITYLNGQEQRLLYGSVFFIGLINGVIALLVLQGVLGVQAYLPLFFCDGGFIILAVTSFRTLVQKSVPNHMAGRVFGVAFSIGDISIPLAMLIYGMLLDYFPLGKLLAASGIGLMLVTLLLVRMAHSR